MSVCASIDSIGSSVAGSNPDAVTSVALRAGGLSAGFACPTRCGDAGSLAGGTGRSINSSCAVAAPAEHHDVETRMIRLRELHQDGLITDKEYRDRRRAILDDL